MSDYQDPVSVGGAFKDLQDRIAVLERTTATVATVIDVSAATTVDIAIPSTARIIGVRFDLEMSALSSLTMAPNGIATAVFSDVRGGAFTTIPAAATNVGPGSFVSHNNGMRLSWPPNGSGAGGARVSGHATFGAMVPTNAGQRRVCVANAAVSSGTGSGNHAVEFQNTATLLATSTAVITFLRFGVQGGGGTMTGRIRVEPS